MKNDLVAVYNTLKMLDLPPTPDNAKHLAGIYIALERVISKADQLEKEQVEKTAQEEKNGGD